MNLISQFEFLLRGKFLLLLATFIFLISLTMADTSSFGYNYLPSGTNVITGGNYTINVNDTQYHQGLTPLQVANLFTSQWLYNSSIYTDNNFIPYVGATSNVDLGGKNVTSTGFAQFSWIDKLAQDIAPGIPPLYTLRLWVDYDAVSGFSTYRYKDDGGMVRRVSDNVFIGENTGVATIQKMASVYSCGSSGLGAYPLLCLARADNLSTMPAIGVTLEAIPSGSYGRVMSVGVIENVNTNSFNSNEVLYVSDIIAGNFTNIKPITPNVTQEIGTILVKSATAGKIELVARSLTGNEFGTVNNFTVAPGKYFIGDGSQLTGIVYNYNQTYSGSTYNATYNTWAYNQSANLSGYWLSNGSSVATGNWNLNYKNFTTRGAINASNAFFMPTLSGAITSTTGNIYNFIKTNATGAHTLSGQHNEFDIDVAETGNSGTFFNAQYRGLNNKVDGDGVYSNYATINSQVDHYGAYNEVIDRIKYNYTGKTLKVNSYGIYNKVYVANGKQYAGTLIRNIYGERILVGAQDVALTPTQIADAYGLYIDDMIFTNSNITGSVYSIYQVGNSNINIFKGNTKIQNDNTKLYFGTGDDATIYYNGTDMLLNPKEVGLGKFYVLGNLDAENIMGRNISLSGNLNVTGTSQTTGNIINQGNTWIVGTGNVSGTFQVNGNVINVGNTTYNSFYAYMYNVSDAGITYSIASSSVYYNVTGFKCQPLNGFSCNGTSGVLTATVSGTYAIDGTICAEAGINGEYGAGISKNGANLETQEACYIKWIGLGKTTPRSVNCMLVLAVGDTINWMMDDEANPAQDVILKCQHLKAVRIGN